MTESLTVQPHEAPEIPVAPHDVLSEKLPGPNNIQEFRQGRIEEADEKKSAFETWKQQQQESKAREAAARRAALEAILKAQPARKPLTDEQIAAHQSREAAAVQRSQAVEKQLDSEELHSKLGKGGFRRLLHPFRNAKILATVTNRARKGEYNPRLANSSSSKPFEIDTLEEARSRRASQIREAEELAKLSNPFED